MYRPVDDDAERVHVHDLGKALRLPRNLLVRCRTGVFSRRPNYLGQACPDAPGNSCSDSRSLLFSSSFAATDPSTAARRGDSKSIVFERIDAIWP